ncbi:unnamed protein product [Schistocephalus solidus]|uniref:C2H2-type domain-containing protein n=1 Tax=Schistocephalus solidus TaxID=70667 RepID=A0A183SKL6_SCHSO|nr:unnamed protein product [Schistocephalus solidus]
MLRCNCLVITSLSQLEAPECIADDADEDGGGGGDVDGDGLDIPVSASAAKDPSPKTNENNHDAPLNINLTIANTSYVGSTPTCLHCNRTFTSRIGLVGHLRLYDSETHRSVDNTDTPRTSPTPATPNYCRRQQSSPSDLSCPHCERNFTLHIGLIGHLRIHSIGDWRITQVTTSVPACCEAHGGRHRSVMVTLSKFPLHQSFLPPVESAVDLFQW